MVHMHDTPRRIIAAAVTLLLLCVVHYTQEAHAVTTNDFTAEQRNHTMKFLRGFLSGATELPSVWTGTDFCEWPRVSCVAPASVDVNLFGIQLGPTLGLSELSDNVDGSQVMVRSLRIVLFEPPLSGTLPESWSRLINMQLIELGGNALAGTLPAAWSSMAALHTIYLNGNHLTGTLPPEWASMKSLQNVMLMKNSLSGALPEAWGSLQPGSLVHLTENNFCGCVPSSWSSLGVDVDESVSVDTCAVTNNCRTTTTTSTSSPETPTTTTRVPSSSSAPEKPSSGDLSGLTVLLVLVIDCVSIAGVVVGVILYRRRTASGALDG